MECVVSQRLHGHQDRNAMKTRKWIKEEEVETEIRSINK